VTRRPPLGVALLAVLVALAGVALFHILR